MYIPRQTAMQFLLRCHASRSTGQLLTYTRSAARYMEWDTHGVGWATCNVIHMEWGEIHGMGYTQNKSGCKMQNAKCKIRSMKYEIEIAIATANVNVMPFYIRLPLSLYLLSLHSSFLTISLFYSRPNRIKGFEITYISPSASASKPSSHSFIGFVGPNTLSPGFVSDSKA